MRLEFYSVDDLTLIIKRNSHLLNVVIDDDAASEIAMRSRGTPRIAVRLLKRVRDFASVECRDRVSLDVAVAALNRLNVDPLGLDSEDKKYLKTIMDLFDGGPVGLDTISAAICESANTVEEVIEPYLLQRGLIQKTARGRVLTGRTFGSGTAVLPGIF
jgi:Holliday junction DNA helicase RuvB